EGRSKLPQNRPLCLDRRHQFGGTFGDAKIIDDRVANQFRQTARATALDSIDEHGVIVNGERIPSRTVIWTAGVEPSAAGRWRGVDTDRAGRVRVQNDLTIAGRPDVFVIGDLASFEQEADFSTARSGRGDATPAPRQLRRGPRSTISD